MADESGEEDEERKKIICLLRLSLYVDAGFFGLDETQRSWKAGRSRKRQIAPGRNERGGEGREEKRWAVHE